MRLIPRFDVVFAERCAWRAIYVYAYRRVPGLPKYATYPAYVGRDAKVFHLGIDPTNGTTSAIFGSILGWFWRVRIPGMQWTYKQGTARTLWQRWVSSLDGRYDAETRRNLRRRTV